MYTLWLGKCKYHFLMKGEILIKTDAGDPGRSFTETLEVRAQTVALRPGMVNLSLRITVFLYSYTSIAFYLDHRFQACLQSPVAVV